MSLSRNHLSDLYSRKQFHKTSVCDLLKYLFFANLPDIIPQVLTFVCLIVIISERVYEGWAIKTSFSFKNKLNLSYKGMAVMHILNNTFSNYNISYWFNESFFNTYYYECDTTHNLPTVVMSYPM